MEEEIPVIEEAEAVDLVEDDDPDEAGKLMAPDGEIAIDAAHFPDAAFRGYVAGFDANGNGSLSSEERNKVNSIELKSANVKSLQGVEHFPNLSYLNCTGNALGSLNLSKNTKLEHLYCQNCALTSLVLGSNSVLSEAICDINQLTALDISQCPNLRSLWVVGNKLAALDISKCPKLVAAVNPSTVFTISNATLGDTVGHSAIMYAAAGSGIQCDFSTVVTGGSPVLCIPIKDNGKTTYKTTVGSVFYLYSTKADRQYGVIHAKSSKGKVVSRTDQGVWTAKAKGTSKLTYKGYDGKTITIATIKVGKAATPAAPVVAPENAITVTKNMKTSVLVGTTHQIFLNGKTGKGFKSSKKKVATVDKNGNIAAVGAGKTKITFKVGKKKRTLTLTVVDPTTPTAIYLDKSGTVAAKVGEPQTITAAFPAGTTSDIKWTSSNKKVATVANGVVTFKKKGKVTITATAVKGKKKAKVKFVVSK